MQKAHLPTNKPTLLQHLHPPQKPTNKDILSVSSQLKFCFTRCHLFLLFPPPGSSQHLGQSLIHGNQAPNPPCPRLRPRPDGLFHRARSETAVSSGLLHPSIRAHEHSLRQSSSLPNWHSSAKMKRLRKLYKSKDFDVRYKMKKKKKKKKNKKWHSIYILLHHVFCRAFITCVVGACWRSPTVRPWGASFAPCRRNSSPGRSQCACTPR